MTILYLFAWLTIGAFAVCYGLIFPSPHHDSVELLGEAHQNLKVFGNTWFGMALSAVFVYFKLKPEGANNDRIALTSLSASNSTTSDELKRQIELGKIIFDGPENVAIRLESEMLRKNQGQKISEVLQELVLHLSEITSTNIRVSSLVRNNSGFALAIRKHFKLFAGHPSGQAVDIGNEEIAEELLNKVANDEEVNRLKIDEIIFDAEVAGKSNRNLWNYD